MTCLGSAPGTRRISRGKRSRDSASFHLLFLGGGVTGLWRTISALPYVLRSLTLYIFQTLKTPPGNPWRGHGPPDRGPLSFWGFTRGVFL